MKVFFAFTIFAVTSLFSSNLFAQSGKLQTASLKDKQLQQEPATKNLYIDVHHLGAGKVTVKDVAVAHQKDLAVEEKYGVNIIQYFHLLLTRKLFAKRMQKRMGSCLTKFSR